MLRTNSLSGDDGNDIIKPGPGLVYVDGGAGDDTVYVTVDGDLHADGRDGTDTLDFSGSARDWVIDFFGVVAPSIVGHFPGDYVPPPHWADKLTVDATQFENVVGSPSTIDQRQHVR